MKTKNESVINQFLQSFGVPKPFKVISTDFFAKKQKLRNQFLRGEPYFFKINIYSFLAARTNYGATVQGQVYGCVLQLCVNNFTS